MPITRTDEYERIVDTSPIADSLARRLQAYPNPYAKKQSVQEYVDTLIDKAGMSDYIKQINSELNAQQTKEAQENITSILQIPDIKNAIDVAIENKRFSNPTPLIVELHSLVKSDPRVPEELKDVMGNQELRSYIVKKMGFGDQEIVNYDLGSKLKSIDHSKDSGTTQNYFSFESTEK